MTANPSLIELAALVEAAAGPDRELDLAIWRSRPGAPTDAQGRVPLAWLHCYTASLDTALTLVPEGWSISMHLSENRQHPVVKLGRSYPTNATIAQEAITLPGAVCAAALRAIAASAGGVDG